MKPIRNHVHKINEKILFLKDYTADILRKKYSNTEQTYLNTTEQLFFKSKNMSQYIFQIKNSFYDNNCTVQQLLYQHCWNKIPETLFFIWET